MDANHVSIVDTQRALNTVLQRLDELDDQVVAATAALKDRLASPHPMTDTEFVALEDLDESMRAQSAALKVELSSLMVQLTSVEAGICAAMEEKQSTELPLDRAFRSLSLTSNAYSEISRRENGVPLMASAAAGVLNSEREPVTPPRHQP